jgi:WXG100 family type VII secretion target
VGDFEAGTAEIQTAAGQMMDTNELLNDAGRQLAAACDAVEGNWKGTARVAFNTLMEQYAVDFQNMNTALMSIAEQVGASATEYAASEEQNQADISSIIATLDNN